MLNLTFDPEDKIQWEDLSPSLQKKITGIIQDIINDPNSALYKTLQKFISSTVVTEINDSNSSVYDCLNKYVTNLVNNMLKPDSGDGSGGGTLWSYIMGLTFTNLPPKVGFLDETTVPLYGAFNMSYMGSNGAAFFYMSDIEGRELIFYNACPGSGGPKLNDDAYDNGVLRTFRAFRMNTSSGYTYDNESVKTPWMDDTQYFITFNAVRTDHIFASMNNGKYYLILTNSSGSPKNWTKYFDVSNLYDNLRSLKYSTMYNSIQRFELSNGSIKYLVIVYDSNTGYKVHALVYSISEPTNTGESISYSLDSDTEIFNGTMEYCKGYVNDGWSMPVRPSFAYVETLNKMVVNFGSVNTTRFMKLSDGAMTPSSLFMVSITNSFTFTIDNLSNTSFFSNLQWANSLDKVRDERYYSNGTYSRGVAIWGGNIILTYDALLDRYIHSVRGEASANIARIYNVANMDWDSYIGRNQGSDSTTGCISGDIDRNGQPLDTCPWSKMIYYTSIIYDVCFFRAVSKKYGNTFVPFIPKQISGNNQWTSTEAGSWSIGLGITPSTSTMGCTKTSVMGTMGCIWYNVSVENGNVILYKIVMCNRTGNNGNTYNNITLGDKLYQATYDQSYGRLCGVFYAPSDNALPEGMYLIHQNGEVRSDKVYNDTHYFTIVHYKSDGSTEVVLTKSSLDLSNSMIDGSKNVIDHLDIGLEDNNLKRPSSFGSISNPFLDTDGNVYFQVFFWYADRSWYNQPMVTININNKTFQNIGYSFGQGYVGSYNGYSSGWTIGYNNKWGYYITGFDGVSTIGNIRTGKDPLNSSHTTEYTKQQVFCNTGRYYRTFSTSGAVGQVAYLQSTPIYLGGYYSLMPASEVYLNANSDNYIYFTRDLVNHTDVNIEVYKKFMGSADATCFNRIPIAMITTNSEGPVFQKNYEVKYYNI